MESPQILGTDGKTIGLRIAERCRECRGALVQSGVELACMKCGVVARTEEAASQNDAVSGKSRPVHDERLGSFMGTKEEEHSNASFNGASSVGYMKSVCYDMGEDAAAWQCASLAERVAGRLSLPAFIAQNAVILSRRLVADRKTMREHGRKSVSRRRRSRPTASSQRAGPLACTT